ncbi:DNA internalization-related competence protein ComEC/Rec2 [Pseudonocardia spinosispora]|uniref:DNA internalization-related competence protein ComEC/Rec2 n=1 Tax=Pseudonocardia spinosispora TaxID=103441 RepID=UPI0003FDDD66|nr:DNA internalization-related competence protein ComEC/Rec2 [Pseudonocardia spinosispora]
MTASAPGRANERAAGQDQHETEPIGPVDLLDLRLVPAAALSWLVAIVGLTIGWAGSAALALVSAVVASTSMTRRGAGTVWASGLLACTGAAAAIGLVVTSQAYQLAGHPLRAAAQHGAAATVRVVLTGDPAPILTAASVGFGGAPGGATSVAVPVDLISAQAEGARWATGGRMVLLAPSDTWARLLPGTELTASGLLAPADRPDLTVAVLRVRGPPTAVGEPPWWQRAADGLRDGLRAATKDVLPQRSAELLPGLAVGDTSTMSWTLREEFKTTGLTHLVAVSGANLVIVCGAVFGLLALLRIGGRWRVAGVLVALIGFVMLVRPSPSVLRAAVMGGVGLLAVLVGRQRPVIPALAASVIALLLLDPALAIDPGFALSVLATAGLVLLAPIWVARLRALGCPPGVAEAIAVPAAAHLVTAPLIAGLSGQVSLVAVVANLAVAPAVAPATVLGVLGAMVSPFSSVAAQFCVWLAGPAAGWLVMVAHWGAGVPNGALPWPSGLPGAILLVAVIVGGLALVRRRRLRALVVAALLGVLLVLVPTRFVTPGWPARDWVMVACDVGQGDALVLATGHPGSGVLIDTGTESGSVDGCLTRLGVVALPLVVLTHMHADHIGGLTSALDGRAVGAVVVGPIREPKWAFNQVRQSAKRHNAAVVELHAGQRLSWPVLTLDVLGPVRPTPYLDPEDGADVNNTSLVMKATTSAGTVLLTGDIELDSQSALLSAGSDLRADVLKIPHHGSRNTDPRFLAAVRPRVALVSVGAGNRYGHPNPGLLNSLRASGAVVMRTDESGDLALVAARDGPGVVARGDPQPGPRRR